jgi:FkbM family methyltransferase
MEDQLAEYAETNARQFWHDAGEMYLNRGFPLCSESNVIDVGGYKGDWTAYIYGKHNCFIDVYEPLQDYCIEMLQRFAGNSKIKIVNAALESHNGREPIAFMEDSSSLYYPLRDDAPIVPLVDVGSVIHGPVDLMALNCEGSEYSILERLIKNAQIREIRHLLVQFHTFVPDAKEKRDHLRTQLERTHTERWCYPFVWEAWSLNYRYNE